MSTEVIVQLPDSKHAHGVVLVDPDTGLAYASSSGGAAATNWATTYTYNAARQITGETRTDGSTTQTRSYTFDAAGNLTNIGAWA